MLAQREREATFRRRAGAILTRRAAAATLRRGLLLEARVKHLTTALALTATLLVAPTAASAQRELPYVYQGTVHAVKGGYVDLITGMGLALRLVHVRIVPATSIVSERGPAALSDLVPGAIVRADCHSTDSGLIADRIEIKRRPA